MKVNKNIIEISCGRCQNCLCAICENRLTFGIDCILHKKICNENQCLSVIYCPDYKSVRRNN